MPVIDVHTHAIPEPFLDAVKSDGLFGIRFEKDELIHPDGDRYPVGPEFFDPVARAAEMQRFGLDKSILSVSPTLFFSSEPADEALQMARILNDALGLWVRTDPMRFSAMATIPLQSPEAAAVELTRAVDEQSLVGLSIGTRVGEKTLDQAGLEPLFAVANDRGLPILLHPNDPPVPQLRNYELANAIGNPLDTTIAAARLIFSGTLDRFPNLRIVLVHAGGFLPYQLGRFDRIYKMRLQTHSQISRTPSEYLDRFWIDSITLSTQALVYLHQLVGPSRLVLGSDYPFDMQDPDPVGQLKAARIDPDVLGEAAEALFTPAGL